MSLITYIILVERNTFLKKCETCAFADLLIFKFKNKNECLEKYAELLKTYDQENIQIYSKIDTLDL